MYDWRARFGLSVNDIGRSVRWGEAWALTLPLVFDPYSHLMAAVRGWMRPPNPAEDAAMVLIDYHRRAHRQRNASPHKPLPRPWEQPRPQLTGGQGVRTDSERAAGRERLKERLGLA